MIKARYVHTNLIARDGAAGRRRFKSEDARLINRTQIEDLLFPLPF
jgi:hypothetical protein